MKKISNIIRTFDKINFNVHKAALATFVKIEGSSYRQPGSFFKDKKGHIHDQETALQMM